MIILEPHDKQGWITAVIQGRWVQAKVYDEPSTYGINDGRVSKLAVGKTDTRDPHSNFFKQMCFNYDRGYDPGFRPSKSTRDLVALIVAELETLPKWCEEE